MIPGSTQESRPMMLSEKKMYDEDYEVIDEEIYQEAIDSAGSIKPNNNTISTAECLKTEHLQYLKQESFST